MANSILKLTVESSEYDAKLKKAAEGIRHLAEVAHRGGGDLTGLEKAELDYIKALGDMETKSRSASGRLRELSNTYKELTVTYNELNEVEKADEGGKDLAASLEKLKQRAQEAQSQMDAATKSLQSNTTAGNEDSSMLSKLADKFTVNIDALKVFSVGLQGAQAALGVARDAFFKNEEQLDTWGRVVEASKSLYSGFLDALNTGDISGYLTRIGEITKAAQDAYNALDALNTFNAFNQVNVEKTRTGMTESIADYRSGQGTKEQVKAAGEAYQKELRERQKLEKQAYLEAIKKVAAERGVNGQDLITALSGSYGSYESLKAIPMSGTRTKFTPGGMFGGSTAYEEAYPVNRQEKLGAALRKLNDTELQSLQALGAQAERTGNEIAQVDKQLTRVLNGRQPGAGGGGGGKTIPEYIPLEGSIDAQTKKVQDLQKAWRAAADDDSRQKIKAQIDEANHELDYMTGKIKPVGKMEEVSGVAPNSSSMLTDLQGVTISIKTPLQELTDEMKRLQEEQAKVFSPEGWQIYQHRINEVQGKIDDFKGNNGITDMAKSWRTAQQAINGVGSAMSGLKNPAIDIMTVIGQSIATIALAYSETLAKDTTSKSNIWSFIAAAAAATVSMATTIASLHSATGYAEGGIIKGNSYSGDNIPIMANAGEVVLTKAMTNNLAAGIQSQGMGGWQLKTRLAGTDLLLSVERTLQKQGYGKIATWG